MCFFNFSYCYCSQADWSINKLNAATMGPLWPGLFRELCFIPTPEARLFTQGLHKRQPQICPSFWHPHELHMPYPSVLDFWKIQSISNWIFTAFDFEIDFCRVKIQFVELDFSNLIFKKSSLKNQVQQTGFLTCKNQFQNQRP